ncbi:MULTISPECIES: methionine ABC transporter ATP-binding protein [unclassified Achromobacter]|uniref:methionine ABC transporter ATP-binding protein n=1 Tax=unclassified Achromobacter TaxID=2626865 RepID=UPI000B514BF2|nr:MULTISPECIES: ATP-binding cassette domain-containing protein [unclassified Achromobacter]OWT68162.1 methionine ABC transporter ATP-binding protein [Achromobacter sp. HZ34]OWT69999.1 methionine ABC transporter ATP-binding protein [Achromobacter sp. HZ28]
MARHRFDIVQESGAAPAQSQTPSAPHIVFEHLAKTYAARDRRVAALEDVSFSVERGEIFGIIGRSGAGKSTLLRAINMLERPSGGSVRVGNVDVGALDEDGLVALRRRVGMIFQHFNLLSAKTVADNVGLPLRVAGLGRATIARRVDKLLDLVGLREQAKAYPAQLSGGQKQRVGIARALVHEPEILLCDEPTSALDPETTHSILGLLRDINRQLGLTVVLITHDMAVIREICHRVLVLDQGRVVEHGDVWRVFGAPHADATRALLRPLRQGLPADIAARMVSERGTGPADVILALRYTGNGTRNGTRGEARNMRLAGTGFAAAATPGVPLRTLAVLGPRARLLQGGVERITGHAQGELLVALPAEDYDEAALAAADHVEVIGYVPVHA